MSAHLSKFTIDESLFLLEKLSEVRGRSLSDQGDILLEEFSDIFPGHSRSGSALRQEGHQTKKLLNGTFSWDKASITKAVEYYNKYSIDGKGRNQSDLSEQALRAFKEKYPKFGLSLRSYVEWCKKFIRKWSLVFVSEEDSSLLTQTVKAWKNGNSLSSTPLFNATCFNCSMLLTKTARHRLARKESFNVGSPLETYFDTSSLPLFQKTPGEFYCCNKCTKIDESPLHVYNIMPKQQLIEIPPELQNLSIIEKSSIALTALFSKTLKKRNYSRGIYQTTVGKTDTHMLYIC